MGSYDFGKLAKEAPKAFEPVPAATYVVECIESEVKTYSSGNHGVNIDVAIAEGEHKGRKIRFTTIVFNPDNPGTFFSNLLGFGISAEFFKDCVVSDENLDELDELLGEVCDEIIGKTASTKVTQDTYQGRVNNKCGFFNPVAAGAGNGRTRRARGGTPDVDPEPTASEPTAEAESGPAPRRSRSRKSSSGEPSMPPGLSD